MRLSVLCAVVSIICVWSARAEDTAVVRAADGFQLPVGVNGTAAGYYIARGYRPNGHLGEDWNGIGGGDTDLGDPVYAAANGFVMFARNYHVGWGNVVILRHAYYEGSELKYCDSLYGHLLDFTVHEGEQVRRGQQIGRIGNNFGMYEAHLHFEMRKNLQIGMFRGSFARDFSNYYTPNEFVAAHIACPKGNSMVSIPINTYPPVAPPLLAGPHVQSPVFSVPSGPSGKMAKINPLPPPGSSSASLPAPKIITRVSTPAPPAPTPEPKLPKFRNDAVARVTEPALTPTPKPAKSTASTVAVASASPTPAPPGKHSKSTAAATTPDPTAKPSKKSSTEIVADASPTPSPTSKHSKSTASAASTPDPTSKPAKATATTAAVASTPAPGTKHAKSVAAVATPTPSPKKGAKSPSTVATAPAATPAAVAVNKTRKPAPSTPVPNAAAVANTNSTNSNTATVITSDPILPTPGAPTTPDPSAPTHRNGSTYKFDRFQDLRGKDGF